MENDTKWNLLFFIVFQVSDTPIGHDMYIVFYFRNGSALFCEIDNIVAMVVISHGLNQNLDVYSELYLGMTSLFVPSKFPNMLSHPCKQNLVNSKY